MGYTTDFEGEFKLNKPLASEELSYLKRFAETRRMMRREADAVLREDPLRDAVGLPVGKQGGYFVNEGGFFGQQVGGDVIDSNKPPSGQPGLWCKWTPNEDGTAIVWDGNEKFYSYVEWLEYLIEHFLGPWGYRINGIVAYQGEQDDDRGSILAVDNVVTRVVA